jgi:thioredoxin 1
MADIVHTSDGQFEQDINEGDKLVVVDLWAEWCGPCKMLEPILEQIADENRDRMKVVKLNIDQNQETPLKFNVMNIPTLLLFKNGKEIDRVVGAFPKRQLAQKIESHL